MNSAENFCNRLLNFDGKLVFLQPISFFFRYAYLKKRKVLHKCPFFELS